MTAILLLSLAVIIDRWVHKTTRISQYYVVRIYKNHLSIHHEPLGFYKQTKSTFFEDRKLAYRIIATRFYDKKYTVTTNSFWIDFDREKCWSIQNKKTHGFHRLVSVYFYWLNRNNWHKNQNQSWYLIGSRYYRQASCSMSDFKNYFLKE